MTLVGRLVQPNRCWNGKYPKLGRFVEALSTKDEMEASCDGNQSIESKGKM